MTKLKDKLLASISNSEQSKPETNSNLAAKKPAASASPKKAAKPKAKSGAKKAKTQPAPRYLITHPQRIWPD